MADVIAHDWSDVVYLALLILFACINAFVHGKLKAKANQIEHTVDEVQNVVSTVTDAVTDVKRATGVVNRADDPDPVDGEAATLPPGQRRITDP